MKDSLRFGQSHAGGAGGRIEDLAVHVWPEKNAESQSTTLTSVIRMFIENYEQ